MNGFVSPNRLLVLLGIPVILLCKLVQAEDSAPNFYAATLPVGYSTNGFMAPVNQMITPFGTWVQLPGVRPNALALNPNGGMLVLSGMNRELLVADPVTGAIRQRVPFPAPQAGLNAQAGSALALNANLTDKMSFTGIAFAPDGSRIYLSNVNGDIKVFAVTNQSVSPLFSIPLPPANLPDRKMDVPCGLAVSAEGGRIYVALNVANQLLELSATNGAILRSWNVGVAPFDVRMVGKKIYVSNWGGRRPDAGSAVGPIGRNGTVRVDRRSVASEGSVSVIDTEGKFPPVEIITGRHASGLAVSPDGKYVAVANAGEDTITVLGTRLDQVVETICARQNIGDLFGAQPNALTFDKHGRKLFVCNGSQNALAVFGFNPGRSQLLGLIPVGWFPGGIVLDGRRNRLDVANLISVTARPEAANKDKGAGFGFNSRQWYGSLSLVPVPSTRILKRITQTALADLRYPLLAQAKLLPRADHPAVPVPERVGEPSVFQHVIYFIKENRTYDQVLGDVSEGNGDPNLCVFGERITPNQHKLVRDFTLLDNTYCCGLVSSEGHQWTDSGLANDYIQRSYGGWPRSYPGAGGDPHGYDAMSYSSAGFIWDDALEHGKTVLDFGEFTTPHHVWKATHKPQSGWLQFYRDFATHSNAIESYAEVGLPDMAACVETNYLGFDLNVPDAFRAARFIHDLKQFEAAGRMPNLLIVWLPDDHTSGTRYGSPTPEAQVADNDLALGKMIEAVSRSAFWTNTCIFAIEDDPQDGWDHVSGYRTTAYVASAYTKRHAVVHTQYNQTSLLRTMELILGIPPMSQFDATATPMFDCFTSAPDFSPFMAIANRVPLDEMNPSPKQIKDAQLRRDAVVSARLPLDAEDQCPEDVFNHILWRAAKGSRSPYPVWAISVTETDHE
jgi:DNA-binding beta-propeller fold protein YncE